MLAKTGADISGMGKGERSVLAFFLGATALFGMDEAPEAPEAAREALALAASWRARLPVPRLTGVNL